MSACQNLNDYHHLLQYERFWTRLYVADEDKKVRWTTLSDAWHYKYIQIDNRNAHNSIVLDVDDGDASAAIQQLPTDVRPNYLVGRYMTSCAWSGRRIIRPHVVFHLKYPVRKSSQKEMRLFNIIRSELISRFQKFGCKVDQNIPITSKNPCSDWQVKTYGDYFEHKKWTLSELIKLLDISAEHDARNKYANNIIKYPLKKQISGRNCELFENLRFEGYRLGEQTSNFEEIYGQLIDIAVSYNAEHFKNNLLDFSEIKNIVKSIAKYCANNSVYVLKSIDSKRRSAAGNFINPEDSLKTRQSVGAKYSRLQHAMKTKKKLLDALQGLKNPTKKGLAKISGVSLNTVKKYWDELVNGGHEVNHSVIDQLEAVRKKPTVLHISSPKKSSELGGSSRCHQDRKKIINSEIDLIPELSATDWNAQHGILDQFGRQVNALKYDRDVVTGARIKVFVHIDENEIPY